MQWKLPVSGGSSKRVWLKTLVVVALLLTAFVAIVVWGQSRLDTWVSTWASDRTGQTTLVTGFAPSLGGGTVVERLQVNVSGHALVCSDVLIPGGVRALLQRPLALVQVGTCTVTPLAAVEPRGGDFQFSGQTDPLFAGLAAKLRALVESVELAQGDVQWGLHPAVRVERFRLTTPAPLSAESLVEVPSLGVEGLHAQIRLLDDGTVSVQPLTPVKWQGLRWSWNSLELRTLEQANVDGIVVADEGGGEVAQLTQVHFARRDGVWTIAASGGQVRLPTREAWGQLGVLEPVAPVAEPVTDSGDEVERAAAADVPSAEEPGRTADEVPTCEGARCNDSVRDAAETLDAFISLASRLPELREAVREMRRPTMRLSLHDVRVNWNDVGIDVARLNLDELGRLEGSLGVDAVQVGFGVDLTTLETLELSANNLDLAPLTGVLGTTGVRGRLNVTGAVRLDDAQQLSWQGRLEFLGAGFDWPAVSPSAVDAVDMVVTGDAAIRWGTAPLMSSDLSLDLGLSPLRLQTTLQRSAAAWQGDAALSLREMTRCQDLWESIPVGMLPNLGQSAITFSGETNLRLSAHYVFGDPWSFELVSEEFPGNCRIARVARQWDPAQLNREGWTMNVTEGVTRSDIVVGPGSGSWVLLPSLPAYVPAAMYLSEEMGFYNGVGISLSLIRRAVALNLERGRYVYGGSTIMQQLVKNLFLSRAKTLSRKLEEAVLVWAMYERVSKERILEYYINCIEFGPDIYGIEAAAQYYFNKPPQSLTPLEAIFLANLKPSPRDGVNYLRRGHSPDRGWWPERTRTMLQRLADIGLVHPEEVDFYAPWVVALPASAAQPGSGYEPVGRPAWAVVPSDGSGQAPPLPAVESEDAVNEAPL